MYFMGCTLSLLFFRSQRKIIRSCQALFGNRQCCDTAKFLLKFSQWSTFIRWSHNSCYIGSRCRQWITNLTTLRKKLHVWIYNKTQFWRSFFRILVLITHTLLSDYNKKKKSSSSKHNFKQVFWKKKKYYFTFLKSGNVVKSPDFGYSRNKIIDS